MNLLSVLIICLGQSALGSGRAASTTASVPRRAEVRPASESRPASRGATATTGEGAVHGGIAAAPGALDARRLDDETYEPTYEPTEPGTDDEGTYSPSPFPTTDAPTIEGDDDVDDEGTYAPTPADDGDTYAPTTAAGERESKLGVTGWL